MLKWIFSIYLSDTSYPVSRRDKILADGFWQRFETKFSDDKNFLSIFSDIAYKMSQFSKILIISGCNGIVCQ